jgi:hypothetical protein
MFKGNLKKKFLIKNQVKKILTKKLAAFKIERYIRRFSNESL